MTTSAVFPHAAHCTSPLGIAVGIALTLLVVAGFAIAHRIHDRREARRWAAARERYGITDGPRLVVPGAHRPR